MKVKTTILKTFIEKARMGGKQKITEAVFNFEKTGLKINANSEPKQVRVMAWLKSTAFTEYEEFGNVGINEVENFIKILQRFGENITIKKEGNLLTISEPGKKVDIELAAEEFLSADTGEPALEFDDTFTIHSNKLKNIYKDASVNTDTVISLKTAEKKVQFSNTGKYKFVTTEDAETAKGGVDVSFGEPLIAATENLDGHLEFNVKNDYPAKILEKTETSSIVVIVAPRVEGEE